MPQPRKDGAAPRRPARTLKRLAREAEALDRHNAALMPSVIYGASDNPDLPPVIPRTLDQLRVSCRDFGEAAVAAVRWTAVSTWLMRDFDNPATAAIPERGLDAVRIMREYDRHRFNRPNWQGRDYLPAIPEYLGLSLEARSAAEQLASEAVSVWERDGGRYLTPQHIKAEYQYITSCDAFRDRYSAPSNGQSITQENAV